MLTFTVRGTPAPQGSKSFKGIHGGHAVLAESSKKVKPWRMDVKAVAEAMHAR
jgi:crossover junction endodeoxyribonuclease RusA